MTVSLEEWIEITNEQDVADPDDHDDPKWQPKKTSVFWKRKAESDMKSLTEHEKGIARIFDLDWLACTKRPTFMEQLGKNLTVRDAPSNDGALMTGFCLGSLGIPASSSARVPIAFRIRVQTHMMANDSEALTVHIPFSLFHAG